ncbi:hypothetical protein GCM10007973_11220 [Polymorphobacter multimanifer]|uniref:Hemerythrin domain-containing protein n=1 Tax=Polymorphobacter multimanifer TaxID=1070431 RepID=A0A841L556_9SPHN|nr:hemerythrin domain-containing protein [Polymorphobacter multimanifer]MBB6226103.1 hypothetical protein [Polymorphobacter multimanifer]GGI76158.1 hypothetical protein GCM10007973_11220 [Polymorphobacter multimanifer]
MPQPPNAIALLTAVHREIDALFEQFEVATPERQLALKAPICAAIASHQALEQQVFYPAVSAVLDTAELIDVAVVERMTTEFLLEHIADPAMSPEMLRAHMTVLREHFAHHAEMEERQIFRRVRGSDLDLEALGARMQAFVARPGYLV